MEKTEFKITLELKPDMLNAHCCFINCSVVGRSDKLVKMFAALLVERPQLVPIIVEALTSMDDITPIASLPNN